MFAFALDTELTSTWLGLASSRSATKNGEGSVMLARRPKGCTPFYRFWVEIFYAEQSWKQQSQRTLAAPQSRLDSTLPGHGQLSRRSYLIKRRSPALTRQSASPSHSSSSEPTRIESTRIDSTRLNHAPWRCSDSICGGSGRYYRIGTRPWPWP